MQQHKELAEATEGESKLYQGGLGVEESESTQDRARPEGGESVRSEAVFI
jgi:hypothetical protein